MPALPRELLEDFIARWMEANRDAEGKGDWKGLAEFFAPDATYGWNIGPKEDVMCVGKDEIRDIALGLEMAGLQVWKQVATDAEGNQATIYGIGGSWFRLNADGLIEWQRDFFDFGHVQKLYLKLIEEGKLSKGMQERIERSLAGEKLPGYYPLGQAPVPIW